MPLDLRDRDRARGASVASERQACASSEATPRKCHSDGDARGSRRAARPLLCIGMFSRKEGTPMTQTTIEDSRPAAQIAAPAAAMPAPATSAASPATDATPAAISATTAFTTRPRTERARWLIETHPLGALAAGAAVAALFEVEFAVGLLAGIGVTALLATQTGAEARREALRRSKHLLGFMRGSSTRREDTAATDPAPASPPS
jgi:hypothetical protein